MTPLTKPISRESARKVGDRPIIVTIAPAGGQAEALIGLRLKGTRTEYVMRLSDIYRIAALHYGQREAAARKAARRSGETWARAKKRFYAANRITNYGTDPL